MLSNYFKIALRLIKVSLSYTMINVVGLGLGIACSILIFSFIRYQLSFDNFHYESDRVYRFVTEQHRDAVNYVGAVPPAFGKAFRDDYTFGEYVARTCVAEDAVISVRGREEDQKFKEEVLFTEPEFFAIFNFPLVSGTNRLGTSNKALITEGTAKKYFGDDLAIGKTFRFDNKIDFEITGVLRDPPVHSDIGGSIFVSYGNLHQYSEWYAGDDSWGGITSSIQTFTRLQKGVDPKDVERVLPDYVRKYRAESKNIHHYKLQPLAEMHFDPRYGGQVPEESMWILAVVGFFLVVTACLNFINLATAQAMGRLREVGVRKAMGGTRLQLFWQFSIETLSIVFLSFLLAVVIAQLALPYLNDLFETHITLVFSDPILWWYSLGVILLVTLVAGAYPSVVMSRHKPASALKGKLQFSPSQAFGLRRSLIIVQLVISQVLLIGLMVVSN